MKVSLHVFDQLLLDIALARGEDGTYFVQKLFSTFLGRPANPHISFFAELNNGFLTPHFTAANGRSGGFRRTLARIAPAHLAETSDRFTGEALRELPRLVEAVDLGACEKGGWLIHYADMRAIRRWIRLARRQSGQFHVNTKTVWAFTAHVLRHFDLPTVLAGAQPADGMAELALRWNPDKEEPELRFLMYFPHGVPSIDAQGQPFLARPAGWYSCQCELAIDDMIGRVLPARAMERVGRQVEEYLARYPRRHPEIDAEADELPAWAWTIFGYYASRLLDDVLAATVERRADPLTAAPRFV